RRDRRRRLRRGELLDLLRLRRLGRRRRRRGRRRRRLDDHHPGDLLFGLLLARGRDRRQQQQQGRSVDRNHQGVAGDAGPVQAAIAIVVAFARRLGLRHAGETRVWPGAPAPREKAARGRFRPREPLSLYQSFRPIPTCRHGNWDALPASEQLAGPLRLLRALVERLLGGGGRRGLPARPVMDRRRAGGGLGVGGRRGGGGGRFGLPARLVIALGEVEGGFAAVGDRGGALVHLDGARVVAVVVRLLAEHHVVLGELRVRLDDALGQAVVDHLERLGV